MRARQNSRRITILAFQPAEQVARTIEADSEAGPLHSLSQSELGFGPAVGIQQPGNTSLRIGAIARQPIQQLLGLPAEAAARTLRLGLGRFTSEADVDYAVAALAAAHRGAEEA